MAAVIEAPNKTKLESGDLHKGLLAARLFSAHEYQQMAESGILSEDERVELIEGRIVQMPPKNIRHATATRRVNRFFNKLLGDRAIILLQDPILLNNYSEPEPDLVLAAPPDEKYLEHHPMPQDILLVLEIADSSLPYDREVKCPLFAQNQIIQFCLLNLQNRELEDYRDPSLSGYRSKTTYTENESFSLVAFPRLSIKVSDLLPPVETKTKRPKK